MRRDCARFIFEGMGSEARTTHLEMTSPEQLRPSTHQEVNLRLRRASPESARRAYARIFEPYREAGRMGWTAAEWAEELSLPGVQAWIAQIARRVVGLVELEASPQGDVGIVVFGLIPELIGKGLGGHFLSLVTQMAWELTSPDGSPTRRVWLQTSSHDHENALRNYMSRGFRIFRTERGGQEITNSDP
jgi:GNAT superfamily N-acetyltransferase